MPPADATSPPKPAGRCPICSAPADAKLRPFCSSRCANVDLLRWMRGAYAIPIVNADDDEDGDRSEPAAAGHGQSAPRAGEEASADERSGDEARPSPRGRNGRSARGH